VNANQTNPSTFTTGAVAEFEITNPTVALAGSGTADAPYLLITLNTSGRQNVNVAYNLRDIDGSTDNSIQPVAPHYRVGNTGNFTNLPAGFVQPRHVYQHHPDCRRRHHGNAKGCAR